MELQPGDLLHDRYIIESILGQGGMGAVYLARDRNLDQQVAIKVNRDLSEKASHQFLKEAQLLAALHHSNLPRVIDYFVSGKDEILVMDYIPGEDLASLIKNKGAQPLEKVLNWAEQLASALTYMHSQNPPVVHRDIKPGNVKITPGGEAVLVDFGIAKASELSQATTTGATGYTPGFAPPEQVSGMHTGPYSDQYSLAATVYQLLSGRQPEDSIQRGLGKQKLTPLLKLVPILPAHVGKSIDRALSLRAEDRFKNIQEFMQALKDPDFKPKAGPVVINQVVPIGERRKTGRQWLWLAGLGGVVIVLVGLAAGNYLMTSGLLNKMKQPPVPTLDLLAKLATDVSQARISTQTQISHLADQTATVLALRATPTPEKFILGGGGELAFITDRSDGKTLQIWTMPVYMNNQSQILPGEARQLTFSDGDKTQPAWSPDGKMIAFVAPGEENQGLDIWIMSADGTGAIDLTRSVGDEFDPSWSPDSALIAFTRLSEEGAPLLYLMRRDGTDSQLLSDLYQESQPTWSADKEWLVYVISAKDHDYLYMRNMQGGSSIPVAFDLDSYFGRLGEVAHPFFSPDGKWIAYTRVNVRTTYICTAGFDARGGDLQQLTTSGMDTWSAWSADNHWIAFQSTRDGNAEIYVMTSSGQMQSRLTVNPARDMQPSWRIH